jgi:hypothetical protein
VSLETLDRAPPGWFVVTLTRAKSRGWDWVALMVNVDPDEMKNCSFFRDSVSFLWINPSEHRPCPRMVSECWVRIPGKHRSGESAERALEGKISTHH